MPKTYSQLKAASELIYDFQVKFKEVKGQTKPCVWKCLQNNKCLRELDGFSASKLNKAWGALQRS